MKKKVLVLVIVLTTLTATGVFATGVGGAFSFSPVGSSPYTGGALSLKLDDTPLLGISASANNGAFNIGVTADWWFVNQNLTGSLNIYVGVGGYGVLTLGNATNLDVGLRIPLGLNIFILDPLEIFLEFAPAAGVAINPFQFPTWGVQSAIGFRFWF